MINDYITLMKKLDLGQFNTKKETWLKPHIVNFILHSGCTHCLDPFAGGGDLLDVVQKLGNFSVEGLDIDPTLKWEINDSLIDVPYREDTIVVTNPPYLSKNSAARRGLSSYEYFSDNKYADLYQIALERVMRRYKKAVFIIPETYFNAKLFKDHVDSITILEDNPFEDTECPVCVVCLTKKPFMTNLHTYSIYKNDEYVINDIALDETNKFLKSRLLLSTKFNSKHGNVGLRGVDGVKPDDRIKFCLPSELNYDKEIKVSSRAITLIDVEFLDGSVLDVKELISDANKILNEYRDITKDITLSPFKNNNKEGIRRRRLDYRLARKILNKSAYFLKKRLDK